MQISKTEESRKASVYEPITADKHQYQDPMLPSTADKYQAQKVNIKNRRQVSNTEDKYQTQKTNIKTRTCVPET